MMGYGIVDVPRTLWRQYNRTHAMEATEVLLVDHVDEVASCFSEGRNRLLPSSAIHSITKKNPNDGINHRSIIDALHVL